VLPLPISTFNADITEGCVPLIVNLSADGGNYTSYSWETSNQLTASGEQANFIFNTNGNYTVSLTTTLNGCASTTSIANLITVENYPIAVFEPSSEVFTEPNQELYFLNTSVGASSYIWEFGDGTTSTEVGPSHVFQVENEGVDVMLYAFSSLGCADSTSLYIGFDPGLVYYIPNTFSPDGDQFNQTFLPIFTYGIDPYNYQMLIYNRWGEIIFESLHPEIGWDGSYGMQGNPAQNGTYTYLITIKIPSLDKRQVIKGHVNLIR
jgi:gliding motility-associated-like protein